MADLDVSIRIPLGQPLPELAAFAARCEEAGFAGVGIPDHHHTGRDAYLALAAMAMATKRIKLFTATSNTVTRHPLVLASLVNSLDELAPGRAAISVARGFLSVEKAGLPPDGTDHLKKVLAALRGLLHDGHATFYDADLHLSNFPGDNTRVMMLASGPRMLEIAGEVADGVMMLVGLHPDGVAAAREHLARGAARAGRDPRDIEETFIVHYDVGTADEMRAYPQGWFRDGRPWLEYPSKSTVRWLRASGLNLPDPMEPSAISDAQADAILDALGLFGRPEHCADRLLRARDEIGLQRAFLFPGHTWRNHYELPQRQVDAYRDVIRRRLADAG